jgi:prepilin-type N-terminal cleavage/methylation domain-containing protein
VKRQRGFTLTEIAIAFLIVSLLLAGFMYTLSAQTDQRNRADTQRRLEEAKELLLTFAIVNGRLPCPARCSNFPSCNQALPAPADGGDEFFVGAPQTACTDGYAGYLPGRAIGFLPVDANGYALDAWGNRIRYAVSQTVNAGALPHFTNAANLKANGISTTPTDLLVCASAGAAGLNTGAPPATTCGANNAVTNQNLVAAIVWSHGKNYRTLAGMSADETMNNKHRLPAATSNHPVFIWHEVRGVEAGAGELDDQLVWIPVGQLYARMIAAGVLP